MNEIQAGSKFQIECAVIGSPPPRLRWVLHRKNLPFFEFIPEKLNRPDARSFCADSSLVKAKLTIPVFTWDAWHAYSCIADNGYSQLAAPIEIHSITAPGPLSALSTKYKYKRDDVLHERVDFKPEIVSWTSIATATLGQPLLIRCRHNGAPEASIFWINTANRQRLSRKASDYEILPSGDLLFYNSTQLFPGNNYSQQTNDETVITQVTCNVVNRHGQDSQTTFIYPIS
ncbi:zwei Ig domain protein zig-2-like [Panonychus citri]|uniref:zwei Ig domain protein zig-2-like n=1 Tax=Panonychus citri TaxID=50023 RepID=UPI002306DEF4|nr:zwei Ig domain protein zig-2-like [Panonychus citri]